MPGIVTDLAWTEVSGKILFIESSIRRGKGDKVTLTGSLGDVMKKSAVIALDYIEVHCGELEIPENTFDKLEIHLHVPEGAIPRDDPSADITMATSLVSTLIRRTVKLRIAMSGEITLTGRVLPVGGTKEKILAVGRAGVRTLILNKENEKDILDIEPIYIEGLAFSYVETIEEALDLALNDQPHTPKTLESMNTEQRYHKVVAERRTLFAQKLHNCGTPQCILRPPSLTDQIVIKTLRTYSLETKAEQRVDGGVDNEYIGIVDYGVIGLTQLERTPSDKPNLLPEEVLELYDQLIGETYQLVINKNHDCDEVWRRVCTNPIADIILTEMSRTKEIEDLVGRTLVSEGIAANYQDIINYTIFALTELRLDQAQRTSYLQIIL